jgi:uncharacterized protein
MPHKSSGELLLQKEKGSAKKAESFYKNQVRLSLNGKMREFISYQTMAFIATSGSDGDCDCSFRAGEPGFIKVLDKNTLIYPELRGNGVFASLGNLKENEKLSLLFIDFVYDQVGLHINGTGKIFNTDDVNSALQEKGYPLFSEKIKSAGKVEYWVWVTVEEAYIHCSKHIIKMVPEADSRTLNWGTDDLKKKKGDFFHAKALK